MLDDDLLNQRSAESALKRHSAILSHLGSRPCTESGGAGYLNPDFSETGPTARGFRSTGPIFEANLSCIVLLLQGSDCRRRGQPPRRVFEKRHQQDRDFLGPAGNYLKHFLKQLAKPPGRPLFG